MTDHAHQLVYTFAQVKRSGFFSLLESRSWFQFCRLSHASTIITTTLATSIHITHGLQWSCSLPTNAHALRICCRWSASSRSNAPFLIFVYLFVYTSSFIVIFFGIFVMADILTHNIMTWNDQMALSRNVNEREGLHAHHNSY